MPENMGSFNTALIVDLNFFLLQWKSYRLFSASGHIMFIVLMKKELQNLQELLHGGLRKKYLAS